MSISAPRLTMKIPSMQRGRRGSQAPRAHGAWVRRCGLWIWLWCLAGTAGAVDEIRLHMDRLSDDGWQLQDVKLTANLDPQARLGAQVEIGEARISGHEHPITQLRLRCESVAWSARHFGCEQGRLDAHHPLLGRQQLKASFRLDRRDGSFRVQTQGVQIAGGRMDVAMQWSQAGWRIQVDARKLEVSALSALLARADLAAPPWQPQGSAAFSAEIHGHDDAVRQLQWQGQLDGLAWSSEDGLQAAEGLQLHTSGEARLRSGQWQVDFASRLARGTVCSEACWSLPETPLRLQGALTWDQQQHVLQLREVTFDDPRGVHLQARADIGTQAPWTLQSLGLRLTDAPLAILYPHYAQPLLIGSAAESLQTQGQIGGQLQYRAEGGSQLDLHLRGASVVDDGRDLQLRGLEAALHWSEQDRPPISRVHWQNGRLLGFALGRGTLRGRWRDDGFALSEPARLAVLDGALQVDSLELAGLGGADLRWRFAGLLEPLSMPAVAEAVGWPPMAGKVSAVIPAVRGEGDGIRVDGVILLRLFDGAVTLRNLRLQRLLGVAPSLRADVIMDNLDLDLLTRRFEFGSIRGRLDGRVENLHMIDWRPVTFDARFATPEDDRSTHRISQRAVENLTRLGGGGLGSALSKTVLSVFEQFSYDRLGISCRLSNGVCQMGGIAPAEQGFYIVRGGGLPRINVIGYSRQVDWRVLINRLQAVTSSEGPVIGAP